MIILSKPEMVDLEKRLYEINAEVDALKIEGRAISRAIDGKHVEAKINAMTDVEREALRAALGV